MFSYVWMKILELRPRSYDRKMDRISRGRVREIKEAVAGEITEGWRVLEIGCGTGELAEMMISRGATVVGFDVNPNMVRAAEERIKESSLGERFSVRQLGVENMDTIKEAAFDAVVSTLVFSELNPDEQRYALRQAHRLLKPGGLVLIADEALPRTTGRRMWQAIGRAPVAAVTFLVTRAGSKPLADPAGLVQAAGFEDVEEKRSHKDRFAMVTGRRR